MHFTTESWPRARYFRKNSYERRPIFNFTIERRSRFARVGRERNTNSATLHCAHWRGKGSCPLVWNIYLTPFLPQHVRWRDPNVFATCGNDKKINVYDIRVATQPNVTSYENAHSLSINTVAWQPGEPFRLISSGFGNVIRFIYARHILTPILKQIRW